MMAEETINLKSYACTALSIFQHSHISHLTEIIFHAMRDICTAPHMDMYDTRELPSDTTVRCRYSIQLQNLQYHSDFLGRDMRNTQSHICNIAR